MMNEENVTVDDLLPPGGAQRHARHERIVRERDLELIAEREKVNTANAEMRRSVAKTSELIEKLHLRENVLAAIHRLTED